jgi:hypothetical protein
MSLASAIEARRLELQRKIIDAKDQVSRAEAELNRFEEWIKAGESLFGRPVLDSEVPTFVIRERVKFNPTSEMAEKVLNRMGKLHMSVLIDHMRKEGWISTGNDRADMKNVHACPSKNKKVERVGRNVWNLREDS